MDLPVKKSGSVAGDWEIGAPGSNPSLWSDAGTEEAFRYKRRTFDWASLLLGQPRLRPRPTIWSGLQRTASSDVSNPVTGTFWNRVLKKNKKIKKERNE